MKTRHFSLAILGGLVGLFLPLLVTYAAIEGPTTYFPDGHSETVFSPGGTANAPIAGSGIPGVDDAFKPAADTKAATDCSVWPASQGKPCFTWSFFGSYFASGICVAQNTCRATAVTPLGGIGMGAIGGVVNGFVQIGFKAFSGGGSTGSTLNPYTSTNPYGTAGCTGTRYISPVQTNDPCGVYIPTTTTTNPNINLNPIGGGKQNVGTSGPASGSLTVGATSGGAPLAVKINFNKNT